ncbi:hypothetical protein L209DRAFT_750617 [Thermothelomyces heterothallicus CBS 203.75]
MAMRGGPRLQVGSAAWITEERNAALSIARSEIEEFSYSARNEIDWLNEHMAEIFSENQMNVAELFKTPGKLRGKTPRTAREAPPSSMRMPLSEMFSATINGASSPFTMQNKSQPHSPRITAAEGKVEPEVGFSESPAKPAVVRPPHQVEPRGPISFGDSGYHGSQSQDTMPCDQSDKDVEMSDSPQRPLRISDHMHPLPGEPAEQGTPSASPSREALNPAGENQERQAAASTAAGVPASPSGAVAQLSSPFASRTRLPILSPRSPSPQKMSSPPRQPLQRSSSPQKPPSPEKSSSSPQRRTASPLKESEKPTGDLHYAADKDDDEMVDEVDEVRSPSDASSPIRPVVRKSSLNFASLPAREPLASKKSLGGARISRTSHLDFHRQSYYNRPTGGKSLGGGVMRRESLEDDPDKMDVDDELKTQNNEDAAAHSKTYTQRLQDQISMLGKGQSTGTTRSSKSLANLLPSQQSAPASQIQSQAEPTSEERTSSPKSRNAAAAPGAFPADEDDEGDWIAPPDTAAKAQGPNPVPSDTQLSDAREELSSRGTATSAEYSKRSAGSPGKPTMSQWTPKHGKSVSVPVLPTTDQLDTEPEGSPLKKTTSVSNSALSTVAEDDLSSPPRSPARAFIDNPLRQVKNKLSSLLKSSKGLIVSSAAVSAEGKSSLLQSPSTTRLGYHQEPSVESFKTADNVVYPDLSQHLAATAAPLSPVRSNSSRRTRSSAERERLEAQEREREEREREKEREREMKEAKQMAEQMDKLEKAREKEREKARVFSKEQEKIAAMEKQVAAQKEQEKAAQPQPQQQDFRTPAPALKNRPRSPTKSTRPTPARANEHEGKHRSVPSDEPDVEMTDATTTVPPPSIPRPTTASSIRTQKRPMKPTRETAAKPKQVPTLIRVNPLSSQQTQFHPSNSVLAANLQETLGQQPGSARQVNGKASQASLQGKGSVQSLKSSVSSTGRPKALEMAAKRKEQEEREAQRKRETKQEMERKRAAQEEERRQEQQRRAEAERQKEEERKAAQRRAAIEKAKQTKAPPPAVRPQPNAPPEYAIAEKGTFRPPSRLGSAMHQESRLVNTVLSGTAKGSTSKRPLQQDAGEESSRSQQQQQQQQRALPSYPAKETKRMRMSEEFDEDLDMMDHNPRIIKGPPVRPSGGFKKDPQPKSAYNNGYPHAPPSSASSKDLFRTTVTAQHNSHSKPTHPLDMAQFSKGAIPFAQNANAHQQQQQQQHKTPARPIGGGGIPKSTKSVARSSPRMLNGELIELPDIQTDDDSEDDDGHMPIAAWADSPALRDALLRQERVDPIQVFGPPAPLNMEEVFSKTKDRFHKFRARTSSANWSGSDRLTEEEVRRDAAARDKMRREGGWSYELSRELV